MDSPLRFCVSCGRAITPGDLSKVPLRVTKTEQMKRGGESAVSLRTVGLSRKSYDFHRWLRGTLYTTSTVLFLIIGYYCTMKYVLHEPLPGHVDEKFLEWTNSGQLIPPALQQSSSAAIQR